MTSRITDGSFLSGLAEYIVNGETMGVKKVQFIPGRKLDPEIKKQYGIADNEYAEIRVVNPHGGIEIKRVKSPVGTVSEVFKKKNIRLKL